MIMTRNGGGGVLIVGCQVCGESKVLAGAPDGDGVARIHWSCRRCGTGQVLQLEVTNDATGCDPRNILGGFALVGEDRDESGFGLVSGNVGGLFRDLAGRP
jgi:ribosomal protein S27AE